MVDVLFKKGKIKNANFHHVKSEISNPPQHFILFFEITIHDFTSTINNVKGKFLEVWMYNTIIYP